jgi:hypothetical protein
MTKRVELPAEWERIVDDNEVEFKRVTLELEVGYDFSPTIIHVHGLSRGRTLAIRLGDLLRAIGEAA